MIINIDIRGESHYPDKDKDGFFFELRDDEGEDYLFEDHVLVNNIGSARADRDILQDAISKGLISSRIVGVAASELPEIYDEVNYC